MSLAGTKQTLRTLHGNVCAALRRGEMAWYGLASDYQSKYAFSADYDSAFKQRYYAQATTCHEIVEHLEALALPASQAEVAPFLQALRDAVRCPCPPQMHERFERLAIEIKTIAEETA